MSDQYMSTLKNDIFEKNYQGSYDYNAVKHVQGLNTLSYLHESRIEKLEKTNEIENLKEEIRLQNLKFSSLEKKISELQELSQNYCEKLKEVENKNKQLTGENRNKHILFFIVLFYFKYFYKPKISTILELPMA